MYVYVLLKTRFVLWMNSLNVKTVETYRLSACTKHYEQSLTRNYQDVYE